MTVEDFSALFVHTKLLREVCCIYYGRVALRQ